MKWILIGLLVLSRVAEAFGAGENGTPGGRPAGLGRVSVALTGIGSLFGNQAAMPWGEEWQAEVFAENRFLMKELCYESAGLSWSGRPGAFGVVLSFFGFQLYNEFNAGISYAKKFGRRFSAGVELNYIRVQIAEGYGSTGTVSCAVGFIYRPDAHWTIGMQISNPVAVKLTDHPVERLPVIFRLGAGYLIADLVLILLEGEKDLENPFQIKSGVEVRLTRAIFGRIGLLTGPMTITGGFGFSLGRLVVDISTGYQTALGFSPSISIGYSFGKKRKQ